jgi:hypothetical protein
MKREFTAVGLSLLLTLACSSCATTSHFESTYGSWVGQSLKSFEIAYGPLELVGADGENVVYKYKMKRMRDCAIYWTVDREGIIVKWRHEGTGCKLAPFS